MAYLRQYLAVQKWYRHVGAEPRLEFHEIIVKFINDKYYTWLDGHVREVSAPTDEEYQMLSGFFDEIALVNEIC